MQVAIINGIYTDSGAPDFRTAYPRNLIPVPKEQGISKGYLRPAEGIEQTGDGVGGDRGGIVWNGVMHRVSGSKLIRVSADDSVTVLGDVGAGGPVTMDYSFDRLGIASGGRLYYWDGSALTQVTDGDLGAVIDVKWIAGYFLATDGTSLVTTDLNNPASVQTLNYGSAEADPDPILAVDELRNEAYAFGRYTVEVFQNAGGTGFPFQRVEGAQVGKGIVGTHAYCGLGDTFVFVGSGRNEPPGVYQMVPGNTQKLSTREIDQILAGYTDEQLAGIVMESRADKAHHHVLIHLPDQCIVYDTIGSQAIGEPIWFTLTTSLVGLGQYRARGLVWCYGRWNVGDPASSKLGRLTDAVSSHWGEVNGWDFGTTMIYNAGNGGIVHEMELIALTGRVAAGTEPVIWASYSLDGQTWSQERAIRVGGIGNRAKRLCWRNQGRIGQWRLQRFRGTSEAHISPVRLELQLESLSTRPVAG